MTKGDLMRTVYSQEEYGNIDPSLPLEYQQDPSINNWSHVMNFNKPNNIFGRLENMFEVADQKKINVEKFKT